MNTSKFLILSLSYSWPPILVNKLPRRFFITGCPFLVFFVSSLAFLVLSFNFLLTFLWYSSLCFCLSTKKLTSSIPSFSCSFLFWSFFSRWWLKVLASYRLWSKSYLYLWFCFVFLLRLVCSFLLEIFCFLSLESFEPKFGTEINTIGYLPLPLLSRLLPVCPGPNRFEAFPDAFAFFLRAL